MNSCLFYLRSFYYITFSVKHSVWAPVTYSCKFLIANVCYLYIQLQAHNDTVQLLDFVISPFQHIVVEFLYLLLFILKTN
jgi:hypothetical protein